MPPCVEGGGARPQGGKQLSAGKAGACYTLRTVCLLEDLVRGRSRGRVRVGVTGRGTGKGNR